MYRRDTLNEMKRIPLTKSKFAIVDGQNFEWLNQWKWYAHFTGNHWYAARREKKTKKFFYMHRQILGLQFGNKQQVDHVNGDGLDNRLCNLRICSQLQNNHNSKRRNHNHQSIYKGVRKSKNGKKWRARIIVNKREICLGTFKTERGAALAYDKAAIKFFGEFAQLNITKLEEKE